MVILPGDPPLGYRFVLFSFLVPKSAIKSPQGVPEHPKYFPKASKEALQGVPEHRK